MADRTGISWTDATWNPVAGCSVLSPGCKRCYAMREAGGRLRSSAKFAGLTQPSKAGPVWTGEVRLWEPALDQPLRWQKPRRIFVNSMSDLFHEAVPDETIDRIFAVMALCPQHTFQVLTKRAERMRDYLSSAKRVAAIRKFFDELSPAILAREVERWVRKYGEALVTEELELLTRHPRKPGFDAPSWLRPGGWPLPNAWLGVSIEDRARLHRLEDLRETPAAVRFLSLEPLLEDLGPLDLRGIDWVIVGSESGPGARPCDLDWVRGVRDRCAAAGVAFFWKQHALNGRKISTPELDGRQWVEYPR